MIFHPMERRPDHDGKDEQTPKKTQKRKTSYPIHERKHVVGRIRFDRLGGIHKFDNHN